MKTLATLGSITALCLLATLASSQADGGVNFTVRDVFEEETFVLSEARGNYVSIHFLLETNCPNCARHVENYLRDASSFPLTKQIFLKGGEPPEIVEWMNGLDVTLPPISKLLIYRDPDAKVAESFAVPVKSGHVKYPAFILIDREGREIFRYVGISKWDYYPLESFRDRMDELDYDPVIRRYNLGRTKLALDGYDVVDYLKRDSAREGTSYFTARYQGAIYYFASETNRVIFAADPDRYLPAYGGWSARAIAEGRRIDIDPRMFKVTNGRLFLFHSDNGRAVRDSWIADEQGLTSRADSRWKAILSE